MLPLVACFLLFLLGLYAVVLKRNLVKMVIGFCLMEYAINLLFAFIGFRHDAVAPIITRLGMTGPFVDPLPQALVLTSIVIGLSTTALMLAFAMRIYEKHKTFDVTEIRRLKG
ncbi:MAG: NADH-quinone oxidoreductase subunit K [bacterium]